MHAYVIILAALCKAFFKMLKNYLIQKNTWLEVKILLFYYFCVSLTRHISRARLWLAFRQSKQLAGKPAEQLCGPLKL